MDSLMKLWCLDCAVTGLLIYASLKYELLSKDALYLSIQVAGLSMISKPVTHMAVAQLDSMGFKISLM